MVGAEYQPMVIMEDLHLYDDTTDVEWKPQQGESEDQSEAETVSMSEESESDVSTI